jgi:hypothetical protein
MQLVCYSTSPISSNSVAANRTFMGNTPGENAILMLAKVKT